MAKEHFLQKHQQAILNSMQELDTIRLLRNMCIENMQNQNDIRDLGLLQAALQVFTQQDQATLSMLQFFVNAATTNSSNAQLILTHFQMHPTQLLQLLTSDTHRKIVAAIAALLLNSCKCFNDAILVVDTQVLEHLLLQLYDVDSEQEADDATEWIKILFSALMEHDSFPYTAFSDNVKTRTLLFEIAQYAVQKNTKLNWQSLLKYTIQLVQHIHIKSKKYPITFAEFETMFVGLEVIAKMASHYTTALNNFVKQNQIPLFQLMCHLLNDAINPDKPNTTSLHGQAVLETGLQILNQDTCMFIGYRTHILQIVANLLYMSFEYQEMGRELGLIPILMSHTKISDQNPHCREWSVFAIRNMMADNLTNQKLVEKMKLDSVDTKVQDEISNMLGTKVKLDSYGKLHLQDDK